MRKTKYFFFVPINSCLSIEGKKNPAIVNDSQEKNNFFQYNQNEKFQNNPVKTLFEEQDDDRNFKLKIEASKYIGPKKEILSEEKVKIIYLKSNKDNNNNTNEFYEDEYLKKNFKIFNENVEVVVLKPTINSLVQDIQKEISKDSDNSLKYVIIAEDTLGNELFQKSENIKNSNSGNKLKFISVGSPLKGSKEKTLNFKKFFVDILRKVLKILEELKDNSYDKNLKTALSKSGILSFTEKLEQKLKNYNFEKKIQNTDSLENKNITKDDKLCICISSSLITELEKIAKEVEDENPNIPGGHRTFMAIINEPEIRKEINYKIKEYEDYILKELKEKNKIENNMEYWNYRNNGKYSLYDQSLSDVESTHIPESELSSLYIACQTSLFYTKN